MYTEDEDTQILETRMTLLLKHFCNSFYYFIVFPYKIEGGRAGEAYKVGGSLIQKFLCALLHISAVRAGCINYWSSFGEGTATVEKDPMQWFCFIKGIIPIFGTLAFPYIVWIKKNGLKYLLQEFCSHTFAAKAGFLTWTELSMFLAFLGGYIFNASAIPMRRYIRAIADGEGLDGLKVQAEVLCPRYPLPISICEGNSTTLLVLSNMLHLHHQFVDSAGFSGIGMMASMLVIQVGNEVVQSVNVGKVKVSVIYEHAAKLIGTINEALSTSVLAATMNMVMYFGLAMFTILDDNDTFHKVYIVAVLLSIGCCFAGAAAANTEMMDVLHTSFLDRRTNLRPNEKDCYEVITIQKIMGTKPLALSVGMFPLTYGMLLSIVSTALTYFLIMLQFVGSKSSCELSAF